MSDARPSSVGIEAAAGSGHRRRLVELERSPLDFDLDETNGLATAGGDGMVGASDPTVRCTRLLSHFAALTVRSSIVIVERAALKSTPHGTCRTDELAGSAQDKLHPAASFGGLDVGDVSGGKRDSYELVMENTGTVQRWAREGA